MTSVKKIFGKTRAITIGAIHFPPLLGYRDFPGFKIAERNALRDLRAFELAGFDGIIFENNYDIPHREFVDPAVIASLTYLGMSIKTATRLPVGISVLWNDYLTALSIAKTLGLAFIRIPVFVDRVKTAYGVIKGDPGKIIDARKRLQAEDIALLTDIHVKHAKLLSSYSLTESADQAIKHGSDGLIITGQWTGDAPQMQELSDLRGHVGAFPIFAGSGADKENICGICKLANGAIVSTSLKNGNAYAHNANIKLYSQRISKDKAKTFADMLCV
jgi:membrane complex biogenesis BtpA family protein